MAKAGAPPKFKEAHVNWVFWKIANHEPMGRKMLVSETGLGEGSLRTILDKLSEYDLVTSAKSGRTLTENGKKVFSRMRQIIRVENIGRLELSTSSNNCLVLVRNASDEVGSGMEQRDEAIKIGRHGATTLIVEKGEVLMPGFGSGEKLNKLYPEDSKKILSLLNPEEGDVIVVGSENDARLAEEASWVAASTLL